MTRFLSGTVGFPYDRERYRETFPIVELAVARTTPPRVKTLARWRRDAPEDFEFVLPAWQAFTHEPSEIRAGLRADLRDDERPGDLGHFKDSPANRRLWEQQLEAADAVGAPIILIETPSTFTPSTVNKARLRSFATEWGSCDGETPRIAWQPGGFWEREECIELCDSFDWVLAVDPLLDTEEPLPGGRLGYFRLLGTHGIGGGYGPYDLERIAEYGRRYETCIVVFKTHEAVHDAAEFRELVSHDDEEADDDASGEAVDSANGDAGPSESE